MSFKHFCGTVPTPNGTVTVKMDENEVTVLSEVDGGTLIIGDKKFPILKNEELKVKL